ncbi:ABC transporter permease [Leifsonia sp. YIM 134122]|uniref:Transport permease protein n=1 Tax=Leifsonia stereocauli TaxID=3134136 RepID=A0ABU9W3K9_9MICO
MRNSRELFINMAQREIKGKYKRTILGQLWSLINPLAAMVIYTIVFGFILRVNPLPGDPSGLDVFPLWLLSGLLPWTFFTAVVTGGMGTLLSHAGLIKKVYFPRMVLVFSTAAAAAYNWAFEMVVLVVALMIFGSFVLPWLPLVIVFMAVLAAFAVGLALMLSIANVFFRDTQYLMSIVLQMWMYLTPIIYPIQLVSSQSDAIGPLFGDVTILSLYRLNPMERFVSVFRNLLYDNRMPLVNDMLFCVVAAIISLVVGYLVFSRHSRKLAELL